MNKYSLKDKIKCMFGFHKYEYEEYICDLPNVSEELIKCNCCRKYHIHHYGIMCGFWFKKNKLYKHVPKEIIEKYNL